MEQSFNIVSEFIIMTSIEELRSIGMFSEGRDAASISQICVIFRISFKLTCVTELNLKNKIWNMYL